MLISLQFCEVFRYSPPLHQHLDSLRPKIIRLESPAGIRGLETLASCHESNSTSFRKLIAAWRISSGIVQVRKGYNAGMREVSSLYVRD
jgi:hypothetical protein